jgi:hypothetical protein
VPFHFFGNNKETMRHIASHIRYKVFLLFLLLVPAVNLWAEEPNLSDTLPSSAYKVQFPVQTISMYNSNLPTVVFVIFIAMALFVVGRYWWDNRAVTNNSDQ